MLLRDPMYTESGLISLMEKDNVGERTIDFMEETLQQGLHEEAFAAANS
jgi:hypothetical protein